MTEPREEFARRQEELVAALILGGPAPAGMDTGRMAAAITALLRKRAGEVAIVWPALHQSLGERWFPEFAGWARGRPRDGSFHDGLAFAEFLTEAGRLPKTAEPELVAARKRA